MAVLTLDDIQFSINTIGDAIEELAHEIAALQNQIDDLKQKERQILDEREL